MRKKSNLKLLFVLLTAGITSVQAATTAFAGDFPERTCGENLTWALSDGILTISGTGDMYDYDRYETPWYSSASAIRKVITDDDVTRIGANSFYGCKELTEVVLGRSVASVGEFAFCDCSALHTFTPGDATHTIDSAFFDTDRLTTILLRNSVTKLSNTFRDMDTVTTFEVDDTDGTGFYMSGDTLYHRETVDGEEIKTLVKYPEGRPLTGTYVPESDTDIIGDKAFYNQELLEEVILPEGIYEIEEFAFRGCSALHTFTPGDATRTIDSAFYDTDLLTTIHLRNSVTELNNTFRDMDTVTTFEVDDTDGTGFYMSGDTLYHRETVDGEEIKTLVKYPEGRPLTGTYVPESDTDIIGDKAFYNQKLLEEVILPEGTYKIEEFAFRGCSALHTFTPGNATSTIDSAFFETDLLTTIRLRNSVSELDNTFRDMDTVTTFEVDDTDGIGFYDVNGILYHYDILEDETVKTLVKCPEGNKFTGTYTAESGTNIIGENAFYGQNLLEAVYLPESVYKVSSHAFYSCTALHGVYFYGKPPVSLPKNTFQNCPSDLILYYIEGTEGWTDPWKGYDTEPFLAKDPVTGDVNGDSIVDTTDIQILIRIFAGWLRRYSDYLKPILNLNAVLDLNKDGFFNSKDVMILNRYLNGWEGFSQYFD